VNYQTINPTTGELVENFATISDNHIEGVLQTAHQVFQKDWRRRSVAMSRWHGGCDDLQPAGGGESALR
jgi:acyl-CoA reductase-like NAD-dependent aldehyde dehydrogenase